MKNIKRIAIIGNCGSGKSILANKLHKITNLPVYHLDQYYWGPNWQRPNIDEYKIIHDNLCDKEEWIIDGMSLRFADYRIKRADIIIYLDIPRYICIFNVIKRAFKYYGKETPSSAQNCPERFNWEFIKFLKFVWDFPKRQSKHNILLNKFLKQHANSKKIYILKSKKQIEDFLNKFEKEENL